ncbi:M23 family metallopeptidase [Dyella acidiphila]|uniref:M23 family metallopeptidase n=1 Tax=Dyella acidiphila TaxID=2775866 RepID=A0ABR9G5M4_9GAMM|nr:M23 family metallopeptidase [Dyella acidiphila]MBE1159320.1 M23 family metallopeptidase [Dyella acidiphila]
MISLFCIKEYFFRIRFLYATVGTVVVWAVMHAVTVSAAQRYVDLPSDAYARTLTRVYDASIDKAMADKSLPRDELASFHRMNAHMPLALARITSEFGDRQNPLGNGHAFHRGIDLAAPRGTPVHAVAAGTVVKAVRDRSYGNVVVIDHHNGYKTLYAHNDTLLVKTGQKVRSGQSIARVGSTGHATGPHLHFEIYRSGQRVNPGPYLAAL